MTDDLLPNESGTNANQPTESTCLKNINKSQETQTLPNGENYFLSGCKEEAQVKPPVKIVFNLESFFSYWLAGPHQKASSGEQDECNEYLKKKLVMLLLESLAQLTVEHNLNSKTESSKSIGFGASPANDRVSLFCLHKSI